MVEVLSYGNFSNARQMKVLLGQIIGLKNFIDPWIYFLLITHIIQTKKECKYTVIGILLLMVLTAITGLMDQFTTVDLGTTRASIAYKGRAAGFAESNQYGAFLVLILPLSLSFMVFKNETKVRMVYSIIFIIGVIGLITTVSRGSYVGFFIAVSIFFFISMRNELIRSSRVFVLVTMLVPITGVIAYSVLPSAVKDAFHYKVIMLADTEKINEDPWREKNKSFLEIYTSGRTKLWTDSYKGFIESPIWGRGNYTVKNVLKIKPHNVYLEMLLKYGIIGFLLYLMIYINIYRKVWYFVKNASDFNNRITFIGFLSGFMGYMVCMFGSGMNTPRYIFWIFAAAIIKLTQIDANKKNKDKVTV
jgi:O-antigen ligase